MTSPYFSSNTLTLLKNTSSGVSRMLSKKARCWFLIRQSIWKWSRSLATMGLAGGVPVAHPLHRLTMITQAPNTRANLSTASFIVFLWFQSLWGYCSLAIQPGDDGIFVAAVIGNGGYVQGRTVRLACTAHHGHCQQHSQKFIHHDSDVWVCGYTLFCSVQPWVETECRDCTTPPHGGVVGAVV